MNKNLRILSLVLCLVLVSSSFCSDPFDLTLRRRLISAAHFLFLKSLENKMNKCYTYIVIKF